MHSKLSTLSTAPVFGSFLCLDTDILSNFFVLEEVGTPMLLVILVLLCVIEQSGQFDRAEISRWYYY